LIELQVLNLSNTQVTETGLQNLKSLRNLKKLFLFQTKVNYKLLHQADFPNVIIDTGGYAVPTFMEDTIVVKNPNS
jgi:hypothetical protein